jgi:diguanylate cyclase (GGDEF)-like protein/PAS domain S-box-containing protein
MMRSPRNADQTRLPIRAATFVTLVCVAILALSGWREWASRNTALKNAEAEMSNLARSLTQHAEDTLELADAVLIGMVDRLETDGTDSVATARLQAFIDLRKATLARIRGLFVYGEDGQWLLTTEKVGLTRFNNSDRDYFQRHRGSADRKTLIGRPVQSRSGGQWILTLSRRFNHPDGSFAGVALMTIDAMYFSNFYAKFEIGANGAIALLSTDGIILARSPDDGTYVGRDLSAAPLFKNFGSRPSASVYYFKSPLDGMQRLSFYKTSDRYELMVLATQAQDDVLAPWRRETTERMAFVLALVGLIAVVGLYLVRQLYERHRMAAALAAKEADFRLLAEESSDMVTRIGWDGRILYVSPSSVSVVGWRADQLTGTPALAGVNSEDLPQVEQLVAALKCGETDDGRIIYRTRHRQKGEIWLESTMHVTRRAETGEVDGVVAVSRDMTARKELEDKLAALATLDGLTGIANRRRFDERLQEEWARARRDGTPLSLLLIDVDHFKKFNDQYGHQAGDACLHSVAQALAEQARRPADLAARYGGEEFALILPNTDAAGCEQVSDSFRGALRDLGIVHALNLPSELVTVSLGGVTTKPSAIRGSIEITSLIEAADQALYAAKDSGRDRLIMSVQIATANGKRLRMPSRPLPGPVSEGTV